MIKPIVSFLILASIAFAEGARLKGFPNFVAEEARTLKKKKGKKSKMEITNLTYKQPLSGFFVMVHDCDMVSPLFTFGQPSSDELQALAEGGELEPLRTYYDGMDGVHSIQLNPNGGALLPGASVEFEINELKDYRCLTVAAMAVNTNDCFVALNGVKVDGSFTYTEPGLDAGTEENNEACTHIPGPACDDTSGNMGGDENGYVHVHRGIHGGGDLDASEYDWRNPMVEFKLY
mmetsp:Transcript_13467/g.14751  ORF Transcript_13467/g.14751 Transcript_13467/m.14751 type:complete len:233 (+) Transcript_13467:59-757(+)